MTISHHHYHKHGEYILHHSDLAGFSAGAVDFSGIGAFASA
ncbi:MAG: hypothetical protein R3E08_02015 [Thiotrichaceae bacterium]